MVRLKPGEVSSVSGISGLSGEVCDAGVEGGDDGIEGGVGADFDWVGDRPVPPVRSGVEFLMGPVTDRYDDLGGVVGFEQSWGRLSEVEAGSSGCGDGAGVDTPCGVGAG